MLPEQAYFQLTPDLRICRVLNGMWQVSGAHGRIDPASAVAAMDGYTRDGFTTWDLADHYGPAEDFIGQYRRALATDGRDPDATIQAFTKWVPRPGPMTRAVVEQAVDVSLRRMQTGRLDLLQFHWWDYADRRYLDALKHLADLREAGKIRHVALTNFDTERLKLITEAGIRIVSNQVQYSLIDRRPAARMAAFCAAHDITLLTYGTLGGGLLSTRYLGVPQPNPATFGTVSLRKYFNMVLQWGSWALFQELLRVMHGIAEKHGISIANVAVRYVLDQTAVAGVIAGARLGLSDNHADNARVFAFALDESDRQALDAASGAGRDLMRIIGDCGDEYR
jgi:aryl-alcohol dehydrogenase-like predicted oxidoreductase